MTQAHVGNGSAATPRALLRGREPDPSWGPAQRRSILVVEDEPALRRLLVSLLSAEGYRTESVADGTLALRILEDEPGIDLVLTDLAMPGIPGTVVAGFLARARPEVKVICMSGDPFPHQRELAPLLERRQADFLAKPFTPSQLLGLVRRRLGPWPAGPSTEGMP